MIYSKQLRCLKNGVQNGQGEKYYEIQGNGWNDKLIAKMFSRVNLCQAGWRLHKFTIGIPTITTIS